MAKLKKEQLTKLRELVSNVREKKVELADLQIAISNAERKKQVILSEISKADESFKSYSKELEEKLGDVNIDLNTGEYTTK